MQRSFPYKGAVVYYKVFGEGFPVVLLHGFGEDGDIFSAQVHHLQQRYRLIVPDLPGTGASELLKVGKPSIDELADCIHALLLHEEINSVIMLGHSMGGYITLAFAEKYDFMLRGFGLMHSTAFADNDEKKENRRKGIEAVNNYGGAAFLKNTIPNLFSKNFKKAQPGVVEQLVEKGKGFSNEALSYYYTAMMNRPDRTAVLTNTAVPVLFIIGTEDAAAPLADLLKQVSLPATSQVNIIEGSGHMGMVEHTDTFNKHLDDFLALVLH